MLSHFCIRRPIFATVLSLLIVIAGLVSMRALPISQYPNITPPTVRIFATYDGADAQTLARTVAAPIEDQLSGVEGLLYYTTSIRSNGEVSIICTFEVGTDSNNAMLEINNRVRTAERRLPEKVRDQGVTVRKRSDENLLSMALWSPDKSMSVIDMADYANLNIVDDLKRIPGIGDVSVFGNTTPAMRIWLDPEKMGRYSITVSDIESAVEAQNAQRSAGHIGGAPNVSEQQLHYTITTPGQLVAPEDFAEIIIKRSENGRIVRLKDVAATEVGKRSYDFRVDLNGEPGVNIGVYLQSDANAMEAARLVKAKIDELYSKFPEGSLDYVITDDTTVYVDASLQEVYKTLLEAGALVLIVVFIFLQSLRATIIPMLAVPVSLIGTMAGLWVLGFSLNTMTLFAMTLAVGIVVDDAIVVLENVERIMRTEGLNAFDASMKAMTEVSGALVAIVLVLSAVFIPVAFLGGIAGELYRQFAVTVAVSVALSGFVALTLTPALCSILLKNSAHAEKHYIFRKFNQGLAASTMVFLQLVKKALKHRVISGMILAAVCAASYQLIQTTPTSFVPKEDKGIVRASLSLPEGAAFPRTEALAVEVLEHIRSFDAVSNVLTMMGFDSLSNDVRSTGATFILKLKPWDERSESADEVQRDLQSYLSSLSEARGVATTPAAIPGLGSTNGFSGYVASKGNDNPLVLQEVTDGFIEELQKRPELTGLRSFLTADTPQIHLTVDRDKAYKLGVDINDVYETVGAMMGSSTINDFTRNGKIYRVVMQAQPEFRTSPEDIGRAFVRSSSGKMIPISSLATVERTSGAESLSRINGYLASQFIGAAAIGTSSGDAIKIVEEVAESYLPDGYSVEWIGQAYHEKRIGSSSVTAISFGLLIMFLILAALYERWSLPIAVVMAVPYALLGALAAVGIRGSDNDIYFQIGLLVLVGLTAKNAILIVEVAAQKMEEGMGPFDAAIAAAGLRFRPILMTSLAFILGVVPLAFATGAGAAARQSMGTGVFGGMLAATFVATIFVPVFFTWFARQRKKR